MAGQIVKAFTIPAGASLSSNYNFLEVGAILVALYFPPAWDPASVTIVASPDAINAAFQSVFDKSGQEYVIAAAAARHVALSDFELGSLRYFKLRSGTAAIPVAQSVQRIIQMVASYR